MTATALQARSLGPSLTVTDLQRSIQFYRDGLGFSVGQEWKEDEKLMGVMLEAGKAFVMLGQDDFAKGKDRTKGVGVRLYIETDPDGYKLTVANPSEG
jgi:catechol 2,3-dioxygenase-like lactoylglutathione lyase family enzyme